MADNIRKVDLVDVELNDGNIHRSFLSHSIGMHDKYGDAFGVRLFRDGVPVDLAGAVAQGYFRNSLGEIIAFSNNVISGNTAFVILPKSCYDHDGDFVLTIKIVSESVTGTMRIVDGIVNSNDTTLAIAPASLFNWEFSGKGWCYVWNPVNQVVETLQADWAAQTPAIPVKPGQRILISNATPGTDVYSIIRLGSTDIGNTLDGVVATPVMIGDESLYIYEVPMNTNYITVGFVIPCKDKIAIEVMQTERDGDVMSQNLFNINAYYTGWLYQPAAGGGVEKNYQEYFCQSNVMPVTPGDLINIYGATQNAEFFFVTNHGSNNIDDPTSSYLIVPIRSMDGVSFSHYTVPNNVHYISVGFVNAFAGKLDVYVGQKSERQKSVMVSFLGDSITQGFISQGVWANPNYPEIVANRLNCVACNYGVSATGICDGSAESFVTRLNRMTEEWIDCLVIHGGTNDYGDKLAHTLGTIDDAPAQGQNFYASFKYLIEHCMAKYPMAQILVVTPIRRNDSGANEYGISMEDIARAEKEVAALYGVHCYDFYHDASFNPAITAQRNLYTSDGLHPNQEGINRFVGPTIAIAVEQLIHYRA